jgi:hypothetical protein
MKKKGLSGSRFWRLFIQSLFTVLLLFISFTLNAQQQTDDENGMIEDLIEEIAATTDEEIDYSQLFDDLRYYYQNPLNLNSATREDLEKFEFLNEIQIYNFLAYLTINGQLLTIYELQLIDGFDKNTIFKLLPFVTVETIENLSNIGITKAVKYGQHQIFLRSQWNVEDQKGFSDVSDSIRALSPNSYYQGSKYKLYARYKFQYKNKLMWGITAEKDPGEEFFKGTQSKGFDYYSAHFQINDIGIVKKLIIGDFQAQFGQGLTISSGMSSDKSSMVLNIKKKAQGLRKYSSSEENKFFRGAATTIAYKNLDFSVFYSSKKIDANTITQDTTQVDDFEASSFLSSGYHRTQGEIADKDAVNEKIFGSNLTFNQNHYKIGATIVHSKYGASLKKDVKPYNIFDFQGDRNTIYGINYQGEIKGINVFGEMAMSENGGKGFVNGLLFPLVPQVQLAVLHRYYEKDFQTLLGAGFGENTRPQNENGLYTGIEIHPYKYWKISTYFDSYRFNWLKYRVNAPSQGRDFFIQIDYAPQKKLTMYLRFKDEAKPENTSSEYPWIKPLENVQNKKFRYHLVYQINPQLTLKNRFEFSYYKKGENNSENGFMIYQDIGYKPDKLPLTFNFRYAIFDTDSYNTRLYAYESDVLYGFSIPPYYEKGIRTYLVVKYDFRENLDCWFRIARTVYSNKTEIGTGASMIEGNTKTEVKVQVMYKF